MIISARQVAVFAYATPVDMRKSFDTLAALIKQELKKDLLSGSPFVFTSKKRKRAKVCTSTARAFACSRSVWRRVASQL